MDTMQEQNPREGVELVEPFDIPTFLCMAVGYWAVLAMALFLFGFMPVWGLLVTAGLVALAGANSYLWTERKTEDCA